MISSADQAYPKNNGAVAKAASPIYAKSKGAELKGR